jgi:hypothetical protein
MPDEIIVCPSCNRKLRMADVHQGQIVQCPLCSVIFRTPLQAAPAPPPPASTAGAPAQAAPPLPPPPSPPRTEPAPPPAPGEPLPVVDVQRALMWPGIGLLICGVLSGIQTIAIFSEIVARGPEGMVRLVEEATPQWLRALTLQQTSPDALYVRALVVEGLSLVISLGMLLGGMQMLRVQWYWLAIVGSLLACVNFPNGCCVMTAPLGLWSLLVLRLPEVRSAFDAPLPPEEPKPEEPDSE